MSPSTSCCVERAGRRLTLRPDGTVLVHPPNPPPGSTPETPHEGRTLVVADVHLGKVEQFRALGVPMPAEAARGARDDTLQALAGAVQSTGARRLVILGDLFHGPASGPALPHLVAMLSDCCAGGGPSDPVPELVVIGGNHDTRAGLDLAPLARSGWRLTLLPEHAVYWLGGEPQPREPVSGPPSLALSHHPRPVPHASYTLAGHWHPCVMVRARPRDHLRLPCFWMGAATGAVPLGVLPAFGAFTGMHPIETRSGDEVFAIASDTVLPVPLPVRP